MYTKPDGSTSQWVASPGSRPASTSNWTRLSNSRATISPLCTSLDAAGSSEAGSAVRKYVRPPARLRSPTPQAASAKVPGQQR